MLCQNCYYQLRVVSHSLTTGIASTLVHSFVVSHLDYCRALCHGLPDDWIDCLDQVLRNATRLIDHIQKFGNVLEYMQYVLHWLPFLQQITYRISALVWHCSGMAPPYLQELGCSTSGVQCWSTLQWVNQAELLVPCSWTAIRQHLSFSVSGSVTWNVLPLPLVPSGHSIMFFANYLKTVLFSWDWTGSASE